MEQNNPPQTNESQSSQGSYEWLKTIIFFGAVLLITFLAIRIIAPFIFTEYVPDIVGLESTTEEAESTGDMTGSEETMPAEPVSDDPTGSDGEEMSESEAEHTDSNTTDETEEEGTVDPLPTEEATSNKSDEAEEEPVETESNYSIYVVQRGETLTSIAKAHHLTVTELIAANELVDPNLLKAGQEIRIPE